MLVPLGLEDAAVHRIPWVSVAIALACFVVLGAVHTDMTREEALIGDAVEEIALVLLASPDLHPSPGCAAESVIESVREHVSTVSGMPEQALDPNVQPQAELDRLCRRIDSLREGSVTHQAGVVPQRGFLQWGWLTHMFMHGGWLHLLGNLFFLYLVAPVLEDVWGRLLFPAFYLVGGVVAALCHAALDPTSAVPMVGASGAVAACMGAFAVRFARRRVRLWLWLGLYTRTFAIPAWGWVALWFADEVHSLATLGADAGVAFMAHVGGCAFGALAATGIAWWKLEERHIRPELDKKQGAWIESEALAAARTASAAGDLDRAMVSYGRALTDNPRDDTAATELAQLQAKRGDTRGATRTLEPALQRAASAGTLDTLTHLVAELGPGLAPEALRPALAQRIAQLVEPTNPSLADTLYRAAADHGGPAAPRMLARAAVLNLEKLGRPRIALALAHQVKSRAADDAKLLGAMDALASRAEQQLAQWGHDASARELDDSTP